jgi:benzoyl-CoA reductase/2-hydroxyglutaryl-CoA dehydratase subunit BcrC/BadD/HgdB
MSTATQTTPEQTSKKMMSNGKMLSIDEIIGTLKKMKEGVKKQPGLMKTTYSYLDAVSAYVERIASAKDEGKWVASHGTQQPLEILEAMDVRGLFNEFWGVVSDIARLESVPEALSVSASTGTPTEVCSFFRNMDGLMHAGKWPRTDFFLYATSCCDNVKAFHTLGRRYDIPSFGLERSYFPYTAHAIEHWKNEYKRLIAFLEEQTGKKMDYDRLKEVVAKSYRLTEIHLEIDNLVANVPCPLSPECFSGTLVAIRCWPGTQRGIDLVTELRDELKERVDKGIGAIENERFRVLWSSFTPFYDPQQMTFMQQKYGAVSVADMLSTWRVDENVEANWMLDPDDPLGNLAYRTVLAPGNCQYSSGIDVGTVLSDKCRRFKVDAAIFNNNFGCKTGAGYGPIIKDELMRQVKVPTLTLDCDVLDHTFVSRADIESQMDSFFESIETSKAYKDRRNLK